MEQTITREQESHAGDNKTVTVKVNNHAVTFQDHKATGLEIKRTAVQQGVAIQEDFNLFRVVGGGQLKPVGDGEKITLHKDEEFRATAPDDNS